MKLKKWMSLTLSMSIIITTLGLYTHTNSYADNSTCKLILNNKEMKFSKDEGTPYIDRSNRLMVPLKSFSEKLGSKVSWHEDTHIVDIDAVVQVDSSKSIINTPFESTRLGVALQTKNSRLYIQATALAKVFGYELLYKRQNTLDTFTLDTAPNLTISAAASLKDAMTEIQSLYKLKQPQTNIALNFGGSGALQQQIEQGASVDVFLSASAGNMNTLKDKGLIINETLTTLLGNKLVLIAPLNTKLIVGHFDEVTDASIKHLALGEPKTVPAGQYAEDVFTYLGILKEAKAKAVYGKDVREVLTWVESGNADAGVVYATDAKTSDQVKVLATATEASHKPILYPMAVVKSTKNANAAKAFGLYLMSDTAQHVFEKYGFSVKVK